MRGIGNHIPPAFVQAVPADNTSRYVDRQVSVWAADGVLVHTEAAREIAAWWQTSGWEGYAFAQFASSGTIDELLVEAIDRQLSDAEQLCGPALWALRAYIVATQE